MIAELIALVRQTRDQFEAHGELNACCASRKLPGSLHQSSLTSLKQCLLAKGESVRLMELNRLARANLSAAEELDTWTLLQSGEGITGATSVLTQNDE